MKKVFVAICFAGFLAMGCGGKEKGGVIDEDIAFESGEMAIEDLSPEDLLEESFELPNSAPPLSPMSASFDDKGLLRKLNPNKVLKGCRVPLLKVIEAPIHLGTYLTINSPSCAQVEYEGTCPVFKTGDVCTRTFSMNCSFEISLPGGITDVLNFTGMLTQSVEMKEINEFADTVTAVNLKISLENAGAYILYNGSISVDLTKKIDGHKVVLSTQNLQVEDHLGEKGDVSGTRTVEVIYGKSIKITNSGTINYISPEEKETSLEIQMSKEISIDGDVKTINISDSIITDGIERTREGKITVVRETNDGDVLKEVVIDGEETITGPRGTFYVSIDDVVLDVECQRNPRGGTITISNGEKEIKIVFKDSCSCEATLILPDGTQKSIDSCSIRRNLCR